MQTIAQFVGLDVHKDTVAIAVTPPITPRASGDRVKTDRRDAIKLARFLRG